MGGRQKTSLFMTKEKVTERMAREAREKTKAKGKKRR
ncbi:hypothetical protein Smar_1014 [Staphylothermus marinus F1]|uniref:Uncharacterized protein n=1 Tax=Staphylothermus marinus (strain ATCC 43588 / DSM 3639 / JCM 9404 / F1) TaxID=399550 RepID=A3DNA2_STAMF|nr:hypothetical protein Smar_1014 [Staphylothermus marinus F1]